MGLPQCLKTEELLVLEDAEGYSVLDRHRATLRPTG